MFKEYSKSLKLPELEKEIISFWEQNKVFLESIERNQYREKFVFYEGPPTANGRPGIHHVISRTIKDLVCRYYTMLGYHVPRKAGWDTHGLPVEIEVEKQLQISGRQQIENYGVEKFNKLCRESVFKYLGDWQELTRRMGYWLDYENPYITFERDYIETVWWLLKQMWDKGLLYKGAKILPYCPRCGTGLSSHEVSLGYKEVEDPSVFVRMKLADEPETSFLVWTTTPWTLISNVALAVGADHTYARVSYDGETLIMAEALVGKVLGEEARVLETFPGRELERKRYTRLFDFVSLPEDKDAFFVTVADFVSLEDGTGIVHVAPAFGADDYALARRYELPLLQPVDESGKFTAEVTPWAGKFVKDADHEIAANLKERGLLYLQESYKHNYPFCWRCSTPLLYYARDSWFISTSKFRQELLRNNSSVNWFPAEVGRRRFAQWLENNVDWALSRDRYWGTPLPIWICRSCGHQHAVGSVAELRRMGRDVAEDIDLHKPYVDDVILDCPQCKGEMSRVSQVIDCWFDSGAMPFAQLHYPFENEDEFGEKFPCHFICEGLDQTRGWFYSLLAISTLITGKAPYRNVLVNDLILDKSGQKMSKSVGNTVDPWDVFDAHGADPLRWYLISVSQPWLPKRFDIDGVAEVVRKFFDTLLNVYSFFAIYANIDKFVPGEDGVGEVDLTDELDSWVISRLNSTIAQVRKSLDGYDLTRAARTIQQFVIDDVSNWYVRRNRRRFWQSGESSDKRSAFTTLWEVLTKVSRMMAPIAPFVSESLYCRLVADQLPGQPPSVHLSSFPEAQNGRIDLELERRMEAAQQLVILGRAARNRSRIKVRQPLRRMLVQTPKDCTAADLDSICRIVREEINVKEIQPVKNAYDYVTLSLKLDFKMAGPKFGPRVREIAAALDALGQDEVGRMHGQGLIKLTLESGSVELSLRDVEVRTADREGYVVETGNGYGVVLDTALDEKLIREGIARELVNKIQNMRKSAGFEVLDRIEVGIESSAKVNGSMREFEGYIRAETLCDRLSQGSIDEDSLSQEWNINDEPAVITIRKPN